MPQCDRCLKNLFKRDICIGRWQPITSLLVRPWCIRRHSEKTCHLLLRLQGLFCLHVVVRKHLLWYEDIWHQMAHKTCVLFVWARSMHAQSSRGLLACTVRVFLWKAPLSSVLLLERGETGTCNPKFGSCSRWGGKETEIVGLSGGARWWVWERYKSVALSGWQEWAAGGRCVICHIFWSSSQCSVERHVEMSEPSLPAVMERATARLDLPWKRKKETARERWVFIWT